MIQLLAYSQSGNEMGIKTWGSNPLFFHLLCPGDPIVYSLRVASLHYYMEKQHEIRSRLIQENLGHQASSWKLAYTDMLTGLNNRQLFEKRLEEYARLRQLHTLSFIDVERLRPPTTSLGIWRGDVYLIDVSGFSLKSAAG